MGAVRLHSTDGTDITPCSAKARALLAYLALSPGGIASRSKIAGILWSEGRDAKASLRQCVKGLRHLSKIAGSNFIKANNESIALDLDALWVDALELERLAARPESTNPETIADLYAGELLEGLTFSNADIGVWLGAERSRLRILACVAIEKRLSLLDGAGEAVLQAARALLRVDPAHEGAHRVVMARHAERGDPAAAIRQYLDCRQALARHLDLSPSSATEGLLARIRRGAIGQKAPPAATQTGATRLPPGTMVSVEQRKPLPRRTTDAAVMELLVAGLRESLSRKRWLSIVDSSVLTQPDTAAAQPAGECAYRIEIDLFSVGGRVRVIAEVMRAGTGRVLWAEHHDRMLGGDLMKVADDLAAALARRFDREIKPAHIEQA
jgi:DNA-binding SARP family transcriptional activator